MFLPVYC